MICIRRGILDNAGQTVTYALQSLGWPEVEDVRIDKIIEFNERKVYSDFFLSNNLFLFCVNILMLVQDL